MAAGTHESAFLDQIRCALSDLGKAAESVGPAAFTDHLNRVRTLSAVLRAVPHEDSVRLDRHPDLATDDGRFLLAVCGFEEVQNPAGTACFRLPRGVAREATLVQEVVANYLTFWSAAPAAGMASISVRLPSDPQKLLPGTMMRGPIPGGRNLDFQIPPNVQPGQVITVQYAADDQPPPTRDKPGPSSSVQGANDGAARDGHSASAVTLQTPNPKAEDELIRLYVNRVVCKMVAKLGAVKESR